MSCPGIDDLGWCSSNLAPTTCKRRRFTGCEWVDISPVSAKVFFRMLRSNQQPVQFLPNRTAMEIKLYREGTECLVTSYDAWQFDSAGYVGFYFDSAILGEPAGYYVGDVFLDCDYCFSLKFRLAPCELIVDDCVVTDQLETCGDEVCRLYDAMGEGTIGGVDCAQVPATEETCGAVPPYFDDSNPGDFTIDVCRTGCIGSPVVHPIAGTTVGGF